MKTIVTAPATAMRRLFRITVLLAILFGVLALFPAGGLYLASQTGRTIRHDAPRTTDIQALAETPDVETFRARCLKVAEVADWNAKVVSEQALSMSRIFWMGLCFLLFWCGISILALAFVAWELRRLARSGDPSP